jgi:hypothetical protein
MWRKQSVVRLAVVAVAAALTVTGLTSCSASDANGVCTFNVQNPHESSGMKKKGLYGYVDAKASVSCTLSLTTLSATIKMQQKVSGKWVDVAGTSHSQTWSNTTADKKYTVMTGEMKKCKGEFRAAARGSGVYKGSESASIAWQYGGSVTNPC